jgi:hypothetical protein
MVSFEQFLAHKRAHKDLACCTILHCRRRPFGPTPAPPPDSRRWAFSFAVRTANRMTR